MNVGKLDRRLIFQSATPAAGEGMVTYTNAFTVWAAIKPLVGTRRYIAQQLDSSIAGTVIVRYRSDIMTSMRMIYGTRILEIISIRNPNESNEWLEIDYKEYIDE